jgi:hypothetical protein
VVSEGVMADFLYWFQVCHLLYSIWHWLQSSKIPANQNCVFSYERNLQASIVILCAENPWTMQPVASRCTDWAIPAPFEIKQIQILLLLCSFLFTQLPMYRAVHLKVTPYHPCTGDGNCTILQQPEFVDNAQAVHAHKELMSMLWQRYAHVHVT